MKPGHLNDSDWKLERIDQREKTTVIVMSEV